MIENKLDTPALSVVIPCYNEEGSIGPLLERLKPSCIKSFGKSYEIILIDDGSTDKCWNEILSFADDDNHICGIKLARNAGHQKALSAGLQHARGDYIFIMDADLQDPPELLSQMYQMVNEGSDVVYGQRRERAGETWFKKKTASLFYRTLSRLSDVDIPKDTGDFRLMTRPVLDALNTMPEAHRFVRGMVSWVGFKQSALLYDRDERFMGETHYPVRKMLSFAIDAITSFSVIPLRAASIAGAVMALIAFFGMIITGITYLSGYTVEGWTSLAVLVLFGMGTQLLFLGVIGEYIGRIYSEVKRRPLYIIEQIYRGEIQSNPVADLQNKIRKIKNG